MFMLFQKSPQSNVTNTGIQMTTHAYIKSFCQLSNLFNQHMIQKQFVGNEANYQEFGWRSSCASLRFYLSPVIDFSHNCRVLPTRRQLLMILYQFVELARFVYWNTDSITSFIPVCDKSQGIGLETCKIILPFLPTFFV